MLEFPEWLRRFPEADLPVQGLRGWLLRGGDHLVLLVEVERETAVPEHAHGDQWGIIVEGELDLTIGGKRQTYRRGDSYFIPARAPHAGLFKKGCRALDFFADPNRYRPK